MKWQKIATNRSTAVQETQPNMKGQPVSYLQANKQIQLTECLEQNIHNPVSNVKQFKQNSRGVETSTS